MTTAHDHAPDVDTELAAIVLAGGRGTRLGGVDKATLEIDGRRLVDRAVAAAREHGAAQIIAVGPAHVTSHGVKVVREDPPLGGPLAALAAALPFVTAAEVLLLACDLERPDLVCSLLAGPTTTDGTVLRDEGGHLQWLAGRYRTSALVAALAAVTAAGQVEGGSLRLVTRQLTLREIEAPDASLADIDDHADLARAGARIRQSKYQDAENGAHLE